MNMHSFPWIPHHLKVLVSCLNDHFFRNRLRFLARVCIFNASLSRQNWNECMILSDRLCATVLHLQLSSLLLVISLGMPNRDNIRTGKNKKNNFCQEKTAFSLCFMVYFVNLTSKQENCANSCMWQNSTNFIITWTSKYSLNESRSIRI